MNQLMQRCEKHCVMLKSQSSLVEVRLCLGVATLFFTLYEPYRNFAPVFAIAAVAMLIAGFDTVASIICINWQKGILAGHSEVW